MRKKKKYKRPRKKKSLYKNKALWIVAAVFAGLFAMLYVLLFAPFIRVQAIEVKGIEDPLRENVQERVGQLAFFSIGPFETKSIVLVKGKEIEHKLLEEFPEIDKANVQKTFKRTLRVSLTKRQEAAVWCQDEQTCFAMDAKGIVFLQKDAEFLLGPLNTLLISSSEPREVRLGANVIPQDLLSSFLFFQKSTQALPVFQEAGLFLDSLAIRSDARVSWTTSEGWEILAKPKEELEWQIAKLGAVLDQKISEEQRKTLEYIDLRFGDQAYIKYR